MITDIFALASVLFDIWFFLFKKIDKCWYATNLSAAVVWLKERNYVPKLSLEAASVFGKK